MPGDPVAEPNVQPVTAPDEVREVEDLAEGDAGPMRPGPVLESRPDTAVKNDGGDEDGDSLFETFVNAPVSEYFPFLDGPPATDDADTILRTEPEMYDVDGSEEGQPVDMFDLLTSTAQLSETLPAYAEDDQGATFTGEFEMWM